jgi:hypothetical protein
MEKIATMSSMFTPGSRTVLGHKKHSDFRLSEKRGLIEGISRIREAGPVFKQDLPEFSHLAVGETVTFDQPTLIEVVEFGVFAYEVDDDAVDTQYSPTLTAFAVNLEAGAQMRGPLVWRHAEPLPAKRFEFDEDTKRIIIIFLVCYGIFGFGTWLADAIEIFLVSLAVKAALVWYICGGKDWLRYRAIAKNQFLFVMAPAERSWD